MVCSACGLEQQDGQFCGGCGARQAAPAASPFAPTSGLFAGSGPQAYMPLGAPPLPGPGYAGVLVGQSVRVRQNLQPLAIAWTLWGIYQLFTGVVGIALMRTFATNGIFGDAPAFLPYMFHALVPVIAGSAVLMSGASLLTAFALFKLEPWGRTLAIIVAILSLFKLPFGTALGIYTLWVLAPRSSCAEWSAITGKV